MTTPIPTTGAGHNDGTTQEATTTIPGGFDPALLQRMVDEGIFLETAAGLIPAEVPTLPANHSLVEHEKNLLASVLIGSDDQRERWGLFRRAIGLRFDEVVPGSLWSQPGLRALALEIDALFRGRRDIDVLNANAIREDLRQRAFEGRFQGSLLQMEEALSEVIAWGDDGLIHPELDFKIACQLFQSAKARGVLYPGLRALLAREQIDCSIDGELERCRELLNEATAITAGRYRQRVQICSEADATGPPESLSSAPLAATPQPGLLAGHVPSRCLRPQPLPLISALMPT